MPTYFFWGEDDFALTQAIKELEKSVVDPNWFQFNYNRIDGQEATAVIEALNQAMTPVFGMGGRLVWLAETSLAQSCPEELLSELDRTLPQIPQSSHLLLTSSKKPDARLKSTKLLTQYAEVREFSPIPIWNTEAILAQVKQVMTAKGVRLTPQAVELLADSVGNDTRRLDNELDKLSLYSFNDMIDQDVVAQLVRCNTHNSLQLASAMRQGNQSEALSLIEELISQNEPPLRIVATLVGQFRTWTMIKLMIEKGEKDDKAIASIAELSNPKRVYFLRQEITNLTAQQLLATLPILLELEANLKLGGEPISTLQTKIIEICQICH